MNVYICVGSSCHLKGAVDIIELMKQAIANYHLEDKIILSGSFCLGRCTDGVSVKIDDDTVCGVSRDNFAQFFQEKILDTIYE